MSTGAFVESAFLAEGVLEAPHLDALRTALGALEPPALAHSGAAPAVADTGHAIVLTGLTMTAPNPEYVAQRGRYEALDRQHALVVGSRAALAAWRATMSAWPVYGCFLEREPNAMLEDRERDVLRVAELGTLLEKPFSVADARNARARTMLQTALVDRLDVNALVAEFTAAAAAAAPADAPDVDARLARAEAAVRVAEYNVRTRYTTAVARLDWAEMPYTREELGEAFERYVAVEYAREARPVGVDRVRLAEDATAERAYTRRLIETSVTTDMGGAALDTVLASFAAAAAAPPNEVLASSLAPAERQHIAALNDTDRARAGEGVRARLRALIGVDARPPAVGYAYTFPDVERRTERVHARTDEARVADFVAVVRDTIRFDAYLALDGTVRPEAWADLSDGEIRVLAAKRALAVDPTEEWLRVRRIRLLDVMRGVDEELEARLERLRYDLSRTAPLIEVPLALERDVYDTQPLRLRVEVAAAPGAPALPADGGTYQFTWRRQGVAAPLRADPNPVASRVAEYTIEPRAGSAADDGVYWAEVAFDDENDQAVTVRSAPVSLAVYATCVRCTGSRFRVARAGTFGECSWRAQPMDAALEHARGNSTWSTYAARIGVAPATTPFIADLDDSVRDSSGCLVRTDAELVAVDSLGEGRRRARYFTYEAIARAIAGDDGAALVAALDVALGDARDDVHRLFGRLGLDMTEDAARLRAATLGATEAESVPILTYLVLAAGRAPALYTSHARYLGVLASAFVRFVRDRVRRHEPEDASAFAVRATAFEVRTSPAWVETPGLPRADEGRMFFDEEGAARLEYRLAPLRARVRYLQRVADDECGAVDERAARLDAERVALGAPFDVPVGAWHAALENGARAHQRTIAAKCVAPLYAADWRGVHSFENTQPDIYELEGATAATLVVARRGSERLGVAFDFGGMHALIERETARARLTGAGEAGARATRYVAYFNVLAQFAPPATLSPYQPEAAETFALLEKALAPGAA